MDREMDSSERDVFELEKGCEDHMNHQNSGITANQQFDNHSIRLVTGNTSIAISQGYQMDSFPSLWNHSTNPQDLNFCENSLQSTMSTSNIVSVGKLVPLSSKLEMDWNSLESISKGGGMFLQPGPGILPQNLSHFPADPRLIDPAVRLPCFNSGGFGGIINPFSTPESSSPYSITSKCIAGASIHTSELNTEQAFKGVSMSIDRASNTGTLTMNQRGNANLQINDNRAHDFSEGDQEESPDSANQSGNSCFRGMSAKKKKRSHQDMELDQVQRNPQLNTETTNENVGTNQKLELNNSTLETAKPIGKQAKESTEASKEDYIHMRARRGQATNSHSLAERVRRERISERMKYLQEIVPGCNKVTGKALMLDEIINYVQSLQRQVEFLSMKLAAVNPRLDFNIEGLLSKDLQSRGGSSMIGFSPDMTHALHPSQHGLVQSGLSGLMNPSDTLRKAVHTQLTSMNGYKEPTPQTSNAWDNQLQSFFQMTFGANLPATAQELNGKLQHGFPL